MNVATIDESRWKAREKYAEYLKATKERHCAEYEALKNAYRELSRGKRVLDLVETLRQAGVDERGRPRLAIVRADAKLCWYRSRSWQRPYPVFSKVDDFGFARPGPRRVEMPSGVFPVYRTEIRCRAVVPSIPPSIAPPERQLHRYHILWEAEWESIPVDPMLLRSLGKGIYTVLATWDLTPLERSVLRHSQIRD